MQVAEQGRWVDVCCDLASANATPRALVVLPRPTIRLVDCAVERCSLVGGQASFAEQQLEQPEERSDALGERIFLVAKQHGYLDGGGR